MEAKRKVAVSIMVMVVLLTTLLATITPVNFTSVLAQDPVSSLTPWVYLPYISRQGSATSEPISTFTPTNTATATATPTPTFTNTPTPTTEPPDILPNHSYFVTDNGRLHVVGEVQNNTADYIRYIEITANFFNSNGQLVDTVSTYIRLDNLPAGDKTCFDISLSEPPDWSYYEFEPPTYSTNGEPLPNLAVLNDSGSYKSTDGSYKVIGQVRNDHGIRVENADSVITLYDTTGAVIGCGSTSINNTRLNPDETSSFERRFFDRDYSDVALYRVQVDGTVQSSPPIDPPDVLSNHSYYVNSSNSLWIVGEIQNNTINYFRLVKITVNIFDDNGQLLDVSYGYMDLDDLPPGNKTCFDILVGDELAGWSYYEFETPSFFIDGEPLPNLTVFNDSGSYDSGPYEIIGQVRNDHGSRVEYVQIVGAIYNDSSIIIGCDSTYVNSTHLDPGQESSFNLRFTGRDYIDVALYRLQADGNPP